MRVLVSGMMAGVPHHGGISWVVLQYILGLERLGHEVFFVEPVSPLSDDPAGRTASKVRSAYFQQVCQRFDLTGRAALLVGDGEETVGAPPATIREFATSADLLVNVSGALTTDHLLERIPLRIYLDIDPGFTQLWAAVDGIDMGFDRHTHHATVGPAIGTALCPIPTCGLDWIGTLPPVVLERWQVAPGVDGAHYTSVANWRGYGSVEYLGHLYGQKAHSFRALADIPERTSASIEIALGIHPDEAADIQLLSRHGWVLRDPSVEAASTSAYEDFVRSSRGEIGIAKSGYVVGRSGWFSDRSACYLASGRPVVAQDTGFADFLPTGQGLLRFSTAAEAAAALDAVDADYEDHRIGARRIAEEYLDSDRVLANLIASVTEPCEVPS